MFAVYAESFSPDDPLSGLAVGERPDPEAPDGWATVEVKAASLNHHDLWSLRGVGLREEALPMILGCDAAGLDEDGNEVVVHAVVSDPGWSGDETLDPRRSLLSEKHQGTFADRVVVPRRNVVPKPPSLSLRGVGLREEALPMILGCDAAGLDEDGNEVVVHAVVSDPGWSGDETLDPRRSLLSEKHQGTFADRVVVPRRNVVPKPPSLSFEEAACLPTAWLTAYRMLFTRGGLKPGDSVLVQGAGGGVATALIALGRAGGLRVYATSRDEAKRRRALELGAHEVVESGARLPQKVDAVMETVGRATWSHSIRSLRPGGTIVTSGATSGPKLDDAELTRIFFLQLSVVGSTMGTRDELASLVELLDVSGVRPVIDQVLPMEQARDGFAAMAGGDVFGKIVFTR